MGRQVNSRSIHHDTLADRMHKSVPSLDTVLDRNNFSDPLTAVPCALSATFHSVIGSFLGAIWRLRPPRTN